VCPAAVPESRLGHAEPGWQPPPESGPGGRAGILIANIPFFSVRFRGQPDAGQCDVVPSGAIGLPPGRLPLVPGTLTAAVRVNHDS